MIDKNSIIHKNAKISNSAEIGPYTIIGPNVEIGKNVEIHSHVNIAGYTKIGTGTKIFPFASIGTQPQDLKFKGEKVNFNITGNVSFKLIKKEEQIEGNCYQNYTLEEGDQLDILSTDKSVYGYLAISGNFEVQFQWNSCSTNTKAKVGANDGEKIEKDQLIKILDSHSHNSKRKLEYINSKIEYIRVIKGTNFNYFSEEGKKTFFEKEFEVTKLTDRMGMRLEGPNIENIIDTNIKSEGIIKGVIQVPADGNPIIMLSDHGTIGGYPKIAVVISADYDKLVQLPPGSIIKFKEIELFSKSIFNSSYLIFILLIIK